MSIDIHQRRFTTDVVAAAAGCTEDIFRQWRNRYGFLKDTVTGGMEVKRFSVLDICVTRAVTVLTDHGFKAPDAIKIAYHPMGIGKQLRALLLGNVEGAPTLLAIIPDHSTEKKTLSWEPLRLSQLGKTLAASGGVMTVFDLNAVKEHVLKFFEQQDGA